MKELEHPPAEPVDWYVSARDAHGEFTKGTIVKARTWFIARDDGAKVLGVDRYQVNVKRAAP